MKIFLFCTVLSIVSLELSAAVPEKEPYFCTRPGTKLYYERHDMYDKNMRPQESEVLVRIENPWPDASDGPR